MPPSVAQHLSAQLAMIGKQQRIPMIWLQRSFPSDRLIHMQPNSPKQTPWLIAVGIGSGVLIAMWYDAQSKTTMCQTFANGIPSTTGIIFTVAPAWVAIFVGIGASLKLQHKHPAVRFTSSVLLGGAGAIAMWIVLGIAHFRCLSF